MADNDITLQKVKLNLTFPTTRTNEPILADAVKAFGVKVDIRRAQVQENVGGYIMCEVTGADDQIDALIEHLKSLDIGIGFIGSDDVRAY